MYSINLFFIYRDPCNKYYNTFPFAHTLNK
jgi:hypothetical protein